MKRLICVLFMIGSGIFASFYGGNLSYALFYFSILLPIFACLYTVYIYARFRVYQTLASYLVVKGDWTEYSFVVANEDYITFQSVKVNFITDKSTIEATDQSPDYQLLPSDSEHLRTRLRCNYRGEYTVGIDSIEVSDFLYLFKIKYPIRSKIKVVVLPRVIQLKRLGIAPSEFDVKNPVRTSDYAEEELDTEIRTYSNGDPIKYIHWKAAAKQGELVSRKFYYKPKAEIFLFMDLSEVTGNELEIIITEDKILDCILAIAKYYTSQGTRTRIIYDANGVQQINLSSEHDFSVFYQSSATISFESNCKIHHLVNEPMFQERDGNFFVVVTHEITKELYLAALPIISRGNHLCILFISNDTSKKDLDRIHTIRKAGVDIYQITHQDEVEDILGGNS